MAEQNPELQPTDSGEAPPEFVAMVRDALGHLYDYAHLECHPLCRLVGSAPSVASRDPARALRQLLLDAVEQINPGPGVPRNSREWRPYGVLVRRYVNGFSIQAVMDEMHISLRQFHRDHHKGLAAVATHLWRLWQPLAEAPQAPASIVAASGLEQEVRSLGVSLRSVEVAALLDAAKRPLEALARGHGVRLGLTPPRQTVIARADSTLARQAILSALTTTIAARPGNVEVTWHSDGRGAIVEVRAWPLDLDRLMTPERRDRLAAVDEIMRAQGGSSRLSSAEPDRVLLQLRFAAAGSARVLLIDDNGQLLGLYRRYLESEGFAVSCATSGAAAFAAVAEQSPDVVVLDVMMRDTDGWQILERLRAQPELARVPVVICSVLDQPELALVMGAQRYLKKPVSQEQLLGVILSLGVASSPEDTL